MAKRATPSGRRAARAGKGTAERTAPAKTGLLRIEQIRSGIDRLPAHRRTLEALGLKHHQDVVIKRDHPAIRGMVSRVRHLVKVTPVQETEA